MDSNTYIDQLRKEHGDPYAMAVSYAAAGAELMRLLTKVGLEGTILDQLVENTASTLAMGLATIIQAGNLPGMKIQKSADEYLDVLHAEAESKVH